MSTERSDDRGEKLEVFKCKRCLGEGKLVDSSRMPSPYEPIGFSEKRAREYAEACRSAIRECPACKGRGVIYG